MCGTSRGQTGASCEEYWPYEARDFSAADSLALSSCQDASSASLVTATPPAVFPGGV